MEIEFKLQLPAGAATGVEQVLAQGSTRVAPLRARYFDTAGATLRAAGIVLRIRQEGTRWMQTVKYGGDGLLAREEHEVDIGEVESETTPDLPDISRHAGSEVGRRLQRVLGKRGARSALVEVFATDITRITCQVERGGSRIELALDRGCVRSGSGTDRRSVPVEELELELKSGDVAPLVALAAEWCARHGLWLGTESKSEKGWRLADPRLPPFDASTGRAIGRGMSGADMLAALIGQALARLLPHASAVAAGGADPAEVHHLRVALRRLRTLLRELGGLVTAEAGLDPSWEPALASAFRQLGHWQDQADLAARLLPELAGEGGPLVTLPAAAATPGQLPEAIARAPELQQALIGLVGFASAPPPDTAGLDARRARALVRRRLDRLHDKVASAAAGFETLPAEQQHRTRKQLKRLRYLGEFAAPLHDADAVHGFLQAIKPAQNALGRQNDEAVALERLRALVIPQPQAWFGVGWLSARRPARTRASRKALQRVSRQTPFWRKS